MAEVVGHGEVVVHFEHFHYEVGVSRAVDGFLRGVERVGGYRGQPVGRCERVGVLPRFAVVRQRDGYLCGTAGGVVALAGVEAALCPVYAELVGQPVGRVDAQIMVVVDRLEAVVARVEYCAVVAVDEVLIAGLFVGCVGLRVAVKGIISRKFENNNAFTKIDIK